MKYEIKQLNENDAVVILSEEIKINDWVIDLETNTLFQVKEQKLTGIIRSDTDTFIEDACKKIIATIYPFKLEGLPMLELPNQEEDVEKLALLKYPKIHSVEEYTKCKREGFIVGYKAAQKLYSEEDVRNVIKLAVYSINPMLLGTDIFTKEENRVIQSLQKKQFPIAVEFNPSEAFPKLKWYYE